MPFSLPSNFLGVTKRIGDEDVPVSKIEPEHGISSGVSNRILVRGLVSVHEEHTARLERGIGLNAWSEMEEMEKALIIADRRIRIATRNLQTEAEIKHAERNAKRSR